MEDDDFSDDFDSEDEDDLELEDEWDDTPSESDDGGKKKKGKKTDKKKTVAAVSQNPPARGRVTRSSGIVAENSPDKNGRKSQNDKSREREEVKVQPKGVKRS